MFKVGDRVRMVNVSRNPVTGSYVPSELSGQTAEVFEIAGPFIRVTWDHLKMKPDHPWNGGGWRGERFELTDPKISMPDTRNYLDAITEFL